MRTRELSEADLMVANRLRLARESLGLTVRQCALELRIPERTWLNYELRKTPLPYDVGLRFCRQFIVSEEWLGSAQSNLAVELWRPFGVVGLESDPRAAASLAFRSCVDLCADAVFFSIPRGSSYGEAYSRYLAPRLRAIASSGSWSPRIRFSDDPERERGLRWIATLSEQWLVLLGGAFGGRGKEVTWMAERSFLRCMTEMSWLVFSRLSQRGPVDGSDVPEWLRAIASDPAAILSPEGLGRPDPELTNSRKQLSSVPASSEDMLAELLSMVKELTAQRGARAALARTLGVPPQQLNNWLRGTHRPNGEMTLRLLAWTRKAGAGGSNA